LKGYLFAGRETGVARSRKSAMNSRALKFVSQGFEIE
jgi:hypothetical protein